jgi:hypothetical protein
MHRLRSHHWLNWKATRFDTLLSNWFIDQSGVLSLSVLLTVAIMKKVFREKVWVHYIRWFSSLHLLSGIGVNFFLFVRGNFLIEDHHNGFWIVFKSLERRIRDYLVQTCILRHYIFTIFLIRCNSARIMNTITLSFELSMFGQFLAWIIVVRRLSCQLSKGLQWRRCIKLWPIIPRDVFEIDLSWPLFREF